MTDVHIHVTLGFSAETLLAVQNLTDALARFTPFAGRTQPAQPGAPGDMAPNMDVSSLQLPAEGPSRAAGTGRGTSAPRIVWATEERIQLLDRLVPSDLSWREIRDRMNTLSGPEMPAYAALNAWAWAKGYRRPRPTPSTGEQQAPAEVDPVAVSPPPEPIEPPAEPAKPTPPAPRVTRAEAMAQAAAAASARKEPIEADQNQIRHKASTWGIVQRQFDLAAINAHARKIGHPGFILKEAARR